MQNVVQNYDGHAIKYKLVYLMKLSFIILILQLTFAGVLVAASASSQNLNTIKVDLNLNNANLSESLLILQHKSGIKISFYEQLLEGETKKVTIKAKNISVSDALKRILNFTNLSYKPFNDFVVIESKPIPPKPGHITGKVWDEKGEPLPGATIKIMGQNKAVVTAVDGSYNLSLDPGTYTLEVAFIGYQSQRITGVIVSEGKSTSLNIALKPSATALGEVVVTSTFRKASIEGMYAKQKNNAAVTNGISREQIQQTPDNNIGQVLNRVSGLQTTDDNKFAVVRGLGERYSNVMLNGSQLPSSEPNRRNFAFDLFSSALVDNITVVKTATPDLPGEFSGGTIQVNTRDIPDRNFLQLEIGTGFNTLSTGKDFMGQQRGKYNYLGFLDNNVHGEPSFRKPNAMTFADYDAIAYRMKGNDATPEELRAAQAFLGNMPNTWQTRKSTAAPMQSYNFAIGKVYNVGKSDKLAFIGALNYRNDQRTDDYNLYQLAYKDYQGKEYNFTTLLGGNLNLAYSFGKNKIALQNTYNRRFSDKMYQYRGIDLDAAFVEGGTPVMGYTSQTLVNELFQTKLQGSHSISKRDIKLEWSADLANTQRDQPFSRLMNSRATSSAPNYYTYYFGNPGSTDYGNVFYSELNEKRYSGQASVQIPFSLIHRKQSFKAGWLGSYRKAGFGSAFYRILNTNADLGNEYGGLPYYDVFNSSRFENGQLYLYPVSGGGEDGANGKGSGYNGSQRLNAFFGMLDLKPLEKLRLVGGMRVETYKQEVGTRYWKPGNTYVDDFNRLDKTEWLPSVNLTYALTPQVNARAAWYKTVARPDIRETSGFSYFDYEIQRTIFGSSLKTTSINNADLRLEWFPSPGEVVSVSGFYKHFKDPIELRMVNTSGRPQYYYENLLSAKDLGLELEVRKSLNFINETSFLKDIYLSGNFTWLSANIDFYVDAAKDEKGNPVSPRRNRPLAGQSPYVINGGIAYQGKRVGFNATYNRFGRRIIYSAVDRSMDEYENPRNMLDLQLSIKPLKSERMMVRFNAANLLNAEFLTYQNHYMPGEKFSGASIQRYPDDSQIPAEQLDPKGAAYAPNYDTAVTRRKFGVSYTMIVTYNF